MYVYKLIASIHVYKMHTNTEIYNTKPQNRRVNKIHKQKKQGNESKLEVVKGIVLGTSNRSVDSSVHILNHVEGLTFEMRVPLWWV